MTQFKTLLISLLLVLQVLGAGSYFKGPGLIEGFTTITSAAGTTTLTKDSETKQILTGSTTQTFVLPDATTLPLGRYFNMINKSSGIMTIQTSGGGALTTVDPGVQKEIHLRAAGSAAGTWDVLAGGGGGVWGSITGTLSAQTDLNTALGLKAPSASPTFTGTIGTPLTASKLLATDASGNLTATAANSSQATYLDLTSSAQTQLNGKLSTSNYSAKGDLVAGVSSGVVAGVSVGSNGKVLVADSGATAGLRWDNATPKKNYVTNWNAEGGVTTGWSTYADASGTQPVDCTGGTPNSTWAASASSTIHDSNNFLATLNTGATRQGEGVSYAFTVDSGDSPAMMSIRFYYKVAGGTFAAGNDADRTSTGDSDFTVWIYDVTNGVMIQPYTYRLYSNSTSVAEPFVSNFQTNSGSTSYRLCIHKGTPTSVSGTAITVRFDDFEISRSNIALNTPVSDWVSYTPTGTFTTNSTYTGLWRRVGDTLESQVKIVFAGAPNSTSLTLNTPTGMTIDTNKTVSTNSDNLIFGSGTILDAGTKGYPVNIDYGSSTSLRVIVQGADQTILYNSGYVTQALPFTIGSGDSLAVTYRVPISGWSSNSQVSDGYDGRQIAASFSTNAGAIATSATTWTTVTFSTPDFDTTSSWNGSDTYTAPSSGVYELGISAGQNSAAANYFRTGYRINSGTDVVLGQAIGKAGGSAYFFASRKVKLNAGDTIQFRAFTEGTEGIAPTRTAFIKKEASPQTMSATEVVAASYIVDGGGQSLTSTAVLQFNTKVFDTHNAVTTGASWKFTAPYQGIYRLSYKMMQVNNTGSSCQISMRKNASVIYRSQPAAIVNGPSTVVSNQMMQADSVLFSLNSGDYIDVYINSAAASGSVYTATTDSWINIERVK